MRDRQRIHPAGALGIEPGPEIFGIRGVVGAERHGRHFGTGEDDDPEPRLLAAMLQWGATSVLRKMNDATVRSEEAMLSLYKRTFDLIAEVRESFAR